MQYTLSDIADIATMHGFDTQLTTISKNGISLNAVSIRRTNDSVGMLINESQLNGTDFQSDDEILNFIADTINNAPEYGDDIGTPSYIKNHCFLCIQKKTNEDIVKKDYLDLELYVRVSVAGGQGTYKVKPHMLNDNLTYEKLFKAAEKNTRAKLGIKGMSKVIQQITGQNPLFRLWEPDEDEVTEAMYVAGVAGGAFGASILWFKSVMKKFCVTHGLSELVIIPSSIHECIFITNDWVGDDVDGMIQSVNSTDVAPEEILSNHKYIYTLATNKITY